MNPREALYRICIALGPLPKDAREGYITAREAILRDAVQVLKDLIDREDQSNDQGESKA